MKTTVIKNNETIYLYPANLVVPSPPNIVHTILGSCVAVCLYDEKNKIGGINHYMLPFWNGQGLPSPKYGNIAIEKLYDKIIQSGGQKSSIIGKIFGGGEVIKNMNSQFNIGQRNILVAQELLNEMKIPIKAQSTGGKLGRKIIFNSFTGEVVQRYVQSSGT